MKTNFEVRITVIFALASIVELVIYSPSLLYDITLYTYVCLF